MNKKVVQIDDKRPYLKGEALCMNCDMVWEAHVTLLPPNEKDTHLDVWLECPKCKLYKGRFRYPFERVDMDHWHCGCGNILFSITRQGMYCPNCGKFFWPDNWGV